MPRAKGKRGLKRFTYKSHNLSDVAKTELAKILCCEGLAEGVQGVIESSLGLAIHGREHLDNPPRPTDYISEFSRVRSDAWKLAERIAEWDYYYRDELEHDELLRIEPALASLVASCGEIIRRYKGLGQNASKGASKNEALGVAIKQLCEIFRAHYQGPLGKRKKRGAFESRADWEDSQFSFVKVALLDAHVIAPIYADSKLTRLIRNGRGAR